MQKNSLLKSEEYLEYIQCAVKCFRNGQYGAVLDNLYLAKKIGCDENWKKDFGILMSESDDDFWSNLCIFNLCYLGTEAICSSGCCSGCCIGACAIFCMATCCGQDPGYCMFQTFMFPIECCCNCLQAECCCE